jgi:hypothetical protein
MNELMKGQEQSVNSFTRGSQIFMHNLRMTIQGMKAAMNVSIFSGIGWLIFRSYYKLSWIESITGSLSAGLNLNLVLVKVFIHFKKWLCCMNKMFEVGEPILLLTA